MGQNESSFRKTYAETVSELSSVQLSEIHARFQELYAKAGGSKGVVVDREAFSNYLNVPVTVGDRLFEAFDKKKVSLKIREVATTINEYEVVDANNNIRWLVGIFHMNMFSSYLI